MRVWRGLGARVIAVEPQPDCLRVLRLFFGRDQEVTIVPGAVGAKPGRAQLAMSTATPTVSSMSPGWITSVTRDDSFARVRWDRSIEVEVTTLDDLIAAHGVPAFCKIDVEGFEADVLAGLTQPLPALSFEYVPSAHDASMEALRLVERLGDYVYNYSPIETMRFASPRWLEAGSCGGSSNGSVPAAGPATSTPASGPAGAVPQPDAFTDRSPSRPPRGRPGRSPGPSARGTPGPASRRRARTG